MLTTIRLEKILGQLPSLTMGVLGDLFLDRYLDIDAALTEPSIETGLDAYQVVRVRSQPGAAGTVINNLTALGVKQIHALSAIGDDGEGYELLQALAKQERVQTNGVYRVTDGQFRTPTYTKPMLCEAGRPPRELNRLDIKNHTAPSPPFDEQILQALERTWPLLDGLLALDQVGPAQCGVVSARVRERLGELGDADPDTLILADSRERLGLFRSVWLKPNQAECMRAAGEMADSAVDVASCVVKLAQRVGRPVFCSRGDQGILLADPRAAPPRILHVPAYPVTGPIDTVGAGDSASAAIACALATGASLPEAAAFGNLVASITIQQLGTTGTATPEQIRRRWHEVAG